MPQVKTYSAQAIAYIKQRLLDGTLSPGDPIRETEIAEHLGISRGRCAKPCKACCNRAWSRVCRRRPSSFGILRRGRLKTAIAWAALWKGLALSSP